MDTVSIWLALRSRRTNERCHGVASEYYTKKSEVFLVHAMKAYRGIEV
jgi:hypothetical protein